MNKSIASIAPRRAAQRAAATLAALALLALGLTACGAAGEEGEAPSVSPVTDTSTAAPAPETGGEEGDEAPALPAADPDALQAVNALQNEEGLARLDIHPDYYTRFESEPTYNGQELPTVLARWEADDEDTVLRPIGGPDDYAVVFEGPGGTLYYNEFSTTLYTLDPESGDITPWADGQGHKFGVDMYADAEHLYTTCFPENSGPRGEGMQLARIAWASGAVELLEGTTGANPYDAYGDTLVLSTIEETSDSHAQVLTAYDTKTGQTSPLGRLENSFAEDGLLFGGVLYALKPQDGAYALEAKNLATGESASLPLPLAAGQDTDAYVMWQEGDTRDLLLYYYNEADQGGADYRLSLATGELTHMQW